VARALNTTIVVTLLQPEPEVFETFDHVILLAEGKVTGRTAAAWCRAPC
jgi:hypothetical protein